TTIARYFFMSALTGRYTGSFETQITADAQAFTTAETGEEYLNQLRRTVDTTLTPDYWAITLPSRLGTSAARSQKLFAHAASLCMLSARVPPFARRTSAGEQKASVYLRDLPAHGEDLQRHPAPRPQQTHRPRTPSKSNTHSSPPPRAAKPKAQP